MKSLATMTAAALLAGMSFALAQNATIPPGTTSGSPSNLNAKPNDPGSKTQSGSQTPGAAAVQGSSTVTPTPGSGPAASPAAANATPNDGGGKTMSGTQSQGSTAQGSGSASAPTATTGTGATQSPAAPDAKPAPTSK